MWLFFCLETASVLHKKKCECLVWRCAARDGRSLWLSVVELHPVFWIWCQFQGPDDLWQSWFTSQWLFFPPSLLVSAERLADTSLPMMPCEPAGGDGLAPKVPLNADIFCSDHSCGREGTSYIFEKLLCLIEHGKLWRGSNDGGLMSYSVFVGRRQKQRRWTYQTPPPCRITSSTSQIPLQWYVRTMKVALRNVSFPKIIVWAKNLILIGFLFVLSAQVNHVPQNKQKDYLCAVPNSVLLLGINPILA